MGLITSAIFSLPAVATLLDLALGDPQRLPHPVRAIGNTLDRLEPRARSWGLPLPLAGALCVLLVAGSSAGLVHLVLRVPLLGGIAALYFSFAGLALGQLLREGRAAVRSIESGDLAAARRAVGLLVSRDTSAMDADELRRTLAETLSENLSDAFVCPLFYLALAGPEGLWAYKAVSTMDSMWGYRTERFRELGRAAARADDALAYVPARLTWLLLTLAGLLLGLDWRAALARTPSDAARMDSPNAGWPMAACAWLLGGGMGGPACYFGEVKLKPILGPEGAPWSHEKVLKLSRLLLFAGLMGTVVFSLVFVLPRQL